MAKLTKAEQKAIDDGMSTRRIVAATTRDEAYLIVHALYCYAGVLNQVDESFPDPTMRVVAKAAQDLGQRYRNANAARTWLESRDGSSEPTAQ